MSGQTKPGSDHEPVDAEFKPVDSEPQPRKAWPRILAIARITGFVVAAALIGGAAGWVLVQTMPAAGPDMAPLQTRLAALETRTVPEPDLSPFETRLSALEADNPGDALRAQAVEQLVRDTASVRERVEALEAAELAEAPDLTGVNSRIEDVAREADRRLDDLEARVGALAAAGPGEGADLSGTLEPVLSRINALNDRIAAVEGAAGSASGTDPRLDLIAQRLGELEASLADMQAGEAQPAPDPASSPDRAEQALAYADLAAAAGGSGSFAPELAELRRVWADAPGLEALHAHARNGAPSRERLSAQLPGDELDAVSGETQVWFGVLRIARAGEDPGPGDALRAALDAGDLEAAVAGARALEDPARTVIDPWLEDAEARLQVDAALREMRAALDEGAQP
jgi:hypothetical protein